MSKEGKGRNQIVYELGLEHVKVSSGSVSNILNEDKNNKSQITDSTINTKVDLKYSGSPSSEILDGVGLTDVTTNNHGLDGANNSQDSASQPPITTRESGIAPLEVKKNEDIVIENHLITNTQDFEKNGYGEDIKKDGGPLSWLMKEARTSQTDPLKSEVSTVNNISGKVINTSLEPDVDFADTPYQEQSEISKTVNHIQDEEEIDFRQLISKI